MTHRMIQFFAYQHSSPRLQECSKRFHELANWIADTLPANVERDVALRRLLESRDSSVRAVNYKEPG
jgi:hypothetical protein